MNRTVVLVVTLFSLSFSLSYSLSHCVLAMASESLTTAERAKKIETALRLPYRKAEVLDLFPKSYKEFDSLCCQLNRRDNLYGCSDLIGEIHNLLNNPQFESKASGVLARTASYAKFDSDAPSFVQEEWSQLCLEKPKLFANAVHNLSSTASQERSLKFLNEAFSKDNDTNFLACIKSLRTAEETDLSERLEKYKRASR